MSRYELKDLSSNGEGTFGEMSKKENGCYVKTATGFIIALLAITIAVGVGLIVHFVENPKLECVFPADSVATGHNQQQIGTSKTGKCQNNTLKQCPTCPPTVTSTSSPTLPAKAILKDVRLSTSLKPTNYVIKIRPEMYGSDPRHFIFTGSVLITIDCKQPTRNVTLHSRNLNITHGSVEFSTLTRTGNSPKYLSHTEDKEREFLIIHLDKDTVAGHTYSLKMRFSGPLKDDLEGLYLSEYKNGSDTIYLAVTQFESTTARKAFPCFDEPAMKATFQVTLVRKSNLISLSNMRKTHEIPIDDDYVEDKYETSEKMSTYLLAFVVGQFREIKGVTEHNLTYGAWARPESLDQTLVALDVGKRTIVNYENYFNIAFPLHKQDMIALPDFRAGAMENWGLITYREADMLFKSGVSSELNRQRITTVVTHELGHQWFGDLVTMDWWGDLWLNEGFATFLEYKGAGMIYPEWRMMEQFVVSEVHKAFETDSLMTSHPIFVPIDNPDKMGEIFDAISYSKGGTIIRMMQFILGGSTFKKGLTRYLNTHKFGNANHNDLWSALSTQAKLDGHVNINVKDIMDTWTLQMNYPVVMVTKDNGKIRLNQERFLKNPDAADPGKYTSAFGYKWMIPFTYTTSASTEFQLNNTNIQWLKESDKEIVSPALTDEDWVIGNVMQYGFYRVNYEDSNWDALTKQLQVKHEVIPAINRAQLINDAWSLARANQLSTLKALNTLEYLDKEMDYIPWNAAQTQLMFLDRMLRTTELYGQFQSFLMSKVKGPFDKFGLDDNNSTHMDSLIRSDIANLACSSGMQECIVYSKRLFEEWMDNPDTNPIDPDLRLVVYCTAIAEGGPEEWNFALEQFKVSNVVTEKVTLTQAMACTKSTWLLSKYLDLCVTPSVIRKQDAVHVMTYIAGNPVGQLLAWDFARANWDYMYNSYGKGAFSFGRLIQGLTLSFNTDFQLKQLEKFKADFPGMGTDSRTFQQVVENTQSNNNWVKRNKDVVSKWLASLSIRSRVTDVRLPSHLTPMSYDITLRPNMYSGDPEKFTFDGYVKIYMTANDVGKNVTLHVNKLDIDESTIVFGKSSGSDGPAYNGERQTDKERQFEIFYLDSDIVVGGEYYIMMNFTGPLTGDLTGLYLSQYKRGNDTIYMATTQFEPTDARKAFPCFDEPQLKATFNVKLVRKTDMKSISNMPIMSNETLEDDFVIDVYNTSAKMSTYLIAFIVCDFEFRESSTKRGVKYRAWARPESINQTEIALETGVKVLSHYEDFFGIDFPLPKQDMIAIPDFAAGAMENWGLITYRETAMLYEEGVSSNSNKQRVCVVVAHELAHQWFGDLVTMKWWDDLWLNEGFASFVEYMGVDFVNPDWKMFDQFVIEDLYTAMDIDSLVTSHPIYVPVQNPDEINEIFDSISYDKGGSVLRMARFFLGENTFKLGLQHYLKNRKYANADHGDLWSALEKQANDDGKDIKVSEILDTWILQMNYPVVMVTKSDDSYIHITQERFLTNKKSVDPGKYKSKFDYQWKIPFTYTTYNNADFNKTDADVIWLDTPEKDINVKFPNAGWIIGNIQQFGFYRVNYDQSNWNNLIRQLNADHKVIHLLNRAQIINDAFGLTKAKQLPMEISLKTVEYLNKEQEYVPWVAAVSELAYIHHMLSESEIYGEFQNFMKKKVKDQYKRLGLNNTNSGHLESYHRSLIAGEACAYGNEECISTAKQQFDTYMSQPSQNPIDPDLRSVVYCTALGEGGIDEWNFLYNKYITATVQAEKVRLLSALACTRQIWILHRLLHLAMDDSVVRRQDAYKVFVAIGRTTIGRPIAWDFFRSNWHEIFEMYGSGSFSMADIVAGVTNSFNTDFQLQQLKDFQKEHQDMGSGTRAYTQAIENTQTNIQWMADNYVIIKKWLEGMRNNK